MGKKDRNDNKKTTTTTTKKQEKKTKNPKCQAIIPLSVSNLSSSD